MAANFHRSYASSWLFHQKNKDEDAFSVLVKQRNIEQIFL
jgi:hypothetical protein